jgi:hypothetical protein
LISPLLSDIALWNWASSVGGRKKHEFALFLLHSALCLRPPLLIARGGHAQLFFESAIAIPQLEGRDSAIAISQLLKKCCSLTAIPQSQLQIRDLRALLPQFLAYFWPWHPVNS